MLTVDVIILAVLAISVIVGLVRGFFREALSVLTWAAARYDAPLTAVQGILPAVHPDASLAAFHRAVLAFRPFSMTALHDLVTLSGSLVLALWVADGAGDADAAWQLSRIDEKWQISQWGEDEEASQAAEIKRAAFLHAARFLDLAGGA